MTVTVDRPVTEQVEVSTTSVTEVVAPPVWLSVLTGKPAEEIPKPRIRELRADSMVPGLFLTNEHHGDDGEYHYLPPLKIEAIDDYPGLENTLRFSFGNGLVLPFEPDELVAMHCIDLPCPSWCVSHWTDAECIHHGSAIAEVEANDAGEVMTVSAYRFDDPDGTCEPVAICLAFGAALIGDALDALTPAQARQLGRLLIDTADLIEGVTQ
jgi:hypothetical protein